MKKSLVLCLFLVGCAGEIKHKMTGPLLQSPESMGSSHAELGMGLSGLPAVELTEDAAIRPPDVSTHKIINTERLNFRIGISPPIEHLKLDAFLELDRVLLKWQIFGESFDVAKRGNISVALIGGAHAKHDTGRGSGLHLKNNTFSVYPDVHYEMKSSGYLVAALAGYRLGESFLVYTGWSYQESRYQGGYDISGRSPSKGRYAGFAKASSAHLGIELSASKNFALRFEDAYNRTLIPGFAARDSEHHFGVFGVGNFSLNMN